MTSEAQDVNARVERTRRNILKMGAILGSAALATVDKARAQTTTYATTSTVPPPNAVHHCFLRGTTILTANGGRKIEDLAVGDLLTTVFGGIRPIQWIARYSFKKSDLSKPWPKDVWPVGIARSAIAPKVPHSELYVTQQHGLFIDNVLLSAGSLINGTTITLYEPRELNELEYFHIKFDRHDVIYAENTPVETLLNVDEGAVNFAEYFRIYGVPKTEETRCAPYMSCMGKLDQLRSRALSAISPWIDRRAHIGVIRDRLEERGIVLSRQPEPSF
jgi:Hint domain